MNAVSNFINVLRCAGLAVGIVVLNSWLALVGRGSRNSLWRTTTALALLALLLAAGVFDVPLAAQTGASPAAPANSVEGSTAPAAPAVFAAAEEAKAAKLERPPDPIPSLTGFRFTPWYELDNDRLWQQIGWKVDLDQLPDDMDQFVELMQSTQLKDSALDLDHGVVATLGIKRLGELPNIEALRLSGGLPLSAKQMEVVGRLPRLRKLDLSQLPSGDAHVKALSPLKNLQVLNLKNTQITGHSLRVIAQHVQLEELYLGGENLTDYSRRRGSPLVVPAGGMFRLAALTKLRTLQIRATGLGSFGWFDALPQLESLDLRRSTQRDLLDAEIAAIARLPKLRLLRLPHPPKVDQVSLLRPLTRLRRLDPISGKNKDQLKAEIQRHLPRTDFGSSDVPALDDGTTVQFSKVPLQHVLRYLSQVHEIPIHLDESSLEEIGVSANEPIDAVLSGITLREVLHRMLSAHGLIAIPNHHGLTVTTQEGNCLYRDDYDLSELLRGVEAGDNLTVRLSQIIQRLVSPDVWGRDFPVLPHENTLHDGPGRILGDQPEKSSDVETATAEIVEAGTTLIVTASAKTHVAIRDIMNQLTHGEDSQLLDANFRQLVETPPKSPHLKNGNATINFSELPLIDGVEFLSRSYLHPMAVDTVSLEKQEFVRITASMPSSNTRPWKSVSTRCWSH